MKKQKVAIITTCSENIDYKYVDMARRVANILALEDYELIFGASSKSMMGECYKEFRNNNKEIYSVTTPRYIDDLNNLPYTVPIVCETTFDLKKEIFENSDVIVMLPGGIGTFSEFFSYIEEKRSSNKNVPIEIYDEDGFYLPLIEMLQILVVNKFASAEILDMFKVSHDKEELLNHINEYKNERKNIK